MISQRGQSGCGGGLAAQGGPPHGGALRQRPAPRGPGKPPWLKRRKNTGETAKMGVEHHENYENCHKTWWLLRISSKRWVIDDFDMENQDFRGFVWHPFGLTTNWKMLWWSLERFGHEFCEWSAMQSYFGPVSGTFWRTFGLKKGTHRSFKKPPFAMATMNFHAELLNGRRIAIPIPLDMTIRELKEELKVWRAVAAVLGLVCFWCGKER